MSENRHPDLEKLNKIGKNVQRKRGELPSVRKDSWQWAAWRAWYKERGISIAWADKQPEDHFFTVVIETPPADIDGLLATMVGGSGMKGLKE